MYIDPTGHSRIGAIIGGIAGAISGGAEKTKDRDRDRSGESSSKDSSKVTGSLGPSISSFFGNPVGIAISNVLEAVKIHYRKGTEDVDGSSISRPLVPENSFIRGPGILVASIDNNIQYLIPGGYNSIQLSAFEDAEVNVNVIKNKNYFSAMLGDYMISKYTYQKALEESLLDIKNSAEMLKNFKSGINFIVNIKMNEGQTPYKSSDFIKGWAEHRYDSGPSISNTIFEKALINKNLAVAEAKLEFINKSPYKDLIYSRPAREKFIEELTKLQEKYAKQDISIYDKDKDNALYNQARIDYVEGIKQININYEKSKENVDYMFKQIKENIEARLRELERSQKKEEKRF